MKTIQHLEEKHIQYNVNFKNWKKKQGIIKIKLGKHVCMKKGNMNEMVIKLW